MDLKEYRGNIYLLEDEDGEKYIARKVDQVLTTEGRKYSIKSDAPAEKIERSEVEPLSSEHDIRKIVEHIFKFRTA